MPERNEFDLAPIRPVQHSIFFQGKHSHHPFLAAEALICAGM